MSNAFEEHAHIPLPGRMEQPGEDLLGMERCVATGLKDLFKGGPHAWILSPNTRPSGSADASRAQHHGDFDDDDASVKATLARILGTSAAKGAELRFVRSASSSREARVRAFQSLA